jgi:hypothetical protein
MRFNKTYWPGVAGVGLPPISFAKQKAKVPFVSRLRSFSQKKVDRPLLKPYNSGAPMGCSSARIEQRFPKPKVHGFKSHHPSFPHINNMNLTSSSPVYGGIPDRFTTEITARS